MGLQTEPDPDYDDKVIAEMTFLIRDIVTLTLEQEYKHLNEEEFKALIDQRIIEILVKVSQKWGAIASEEGSLQ